MINPNKIQRIHNFQLNRNSPTIDKSPKSFHLITERIENAYNKKFYDKIHSPQKEEKFDRSLSSINNFSYTKTVVFLKNSEIKSKNEEERLNFTKKNISQKKKLLRLEDFVKTEKNSPVLMTPNDQNNILNHFYDKKKGFLQEIKADQDKKNFFLSKKLKQIQTRSTSNKNTKLSERSLIFTSKIHEKDHEIYKTSKETPEITNLQD